MKLKADRTNETEPSLGVLVNCRIIRTGCPNNSAIGPNNSEIGPNNSAIDE